MRSAVFWSTALRVVAMGAKFILAGLMVLFLSPAEIGTYELLFRSVANGVLLVGMQFFLYANRELSSARGDDRGTVIRNQFVFYCLSYLVVLPLSLSAFFGGVLDWHLIGWFYALLVFDQISYETVRHLMSTEQPVRSNFIHTLRTGLWVVPVALLFLFYPPSRNLATVYGSWLGASILSVLLSLWWLRGLGIGKALRVKIDWGWMKSGWDTTLQYVPVTLSMFAFTLLDRYAIEVMAPAANGVDTRDLVGAYGIYAMMANLVVTFPEAGMVSIMGPKMIRAYREGRPEEFDRLHTYLGWNLAKSIAVTSVVATLGMGLYLMLKRDEPVYTSQFPAYFVTLAAAICNAMAMWPRLRLFAAGRDKAIAWMHVLGVLPFLLLLAVLVPFFGVMGAAIALLVGFAIRLALALHYAAKTPAPPAQPQEEPEPA